MRCVRILAAGLLASSLLLAGCGDGDPALLQTGVLHVSRGGTGQVFVSRTQETFPFSDSVTVAVRGDNDAADEFTIYTFFGLSDLGLDEVPDAALVTFVDGLDPDESSSTEVPSSVMATVFHRGFDVSAARIAAQDADQTYERGSNGAFVIEPRPNADGTFPLSRSAAKRVRFSVVTLVDTGTGDEALVDGSADYELSQDISQRFFGYTGNLGLNTPPSETGGGPPPPPGSTGGGSSTGGGTDSPPSPPL